LKVDGFRALILRNLPNQKESDLYTVVSVSWENP
jgi:hypothetical protein